jgi:hypothetical protein
MFRCPGIGDSYPEPVPADLGHNGRMSASRRVRLVAVLVSCTALFAMSSCSSPQSSAGYPTTAPAVAKAYFTSMAIHHWSDAAAFLMPSMRKAFLHGPDSGPANFASISHIQVVRGGPDPTDETGDYRKLYLPYTVLWELAVDYDAVYVPNSFERTMNPGNGIKTRFIILGRKNGAGPWQIISIGSGP